MKAKQQRNKGSEIYPIDASNSSRNIHTQRTETRDIQRDIEIKAAVNNDDDILLELSVCSLNDVSTT
ncbi:MAG: hypothetical protein M3275_01600 [Thermoproteota archaeon]|nr:hypothetical protein [Thermoproteota archaeon]